ncbi:hypothetical protein HCH_03762 [Hahella chejuensis KCTC 2396]|uniref:Uncharacterized protein n=1 Tax=Hahella chejuensis (strain KCTC 2396) TaxID=349521 RepID=Q2SFT0_HAHCH|nr:hypothetical protein HCH_03762 [Hahella chejuensis KCTC 2396]
MIIIVIINNLSITIFVIILRKLPADDTHPVFNIYLIIGFNRKKLSKHLS